MAERLILTYEQGDEATFGYETQTPVIASSKDELLEVLLQAATIRFEKKLELAPQLKKSFEVLQANRVAVQNSRDNRTSAMLDALHIAEASHEKLASELYASRWFPLGDTFLELDDFISSCTKTTFTFTPPRVQTVDEFFEGAPEV